MSFRFTGGTRDRDHETDRPSARVGPVRRLREQTIPVSEIG